MWIVIENGVYRHDIKGVFDSLTGAVDRAAKSAEQSDGYHDYQVGELPLNEAIEDVKLICEFTKRNQHGNVIGIVQRRELT